MEQYSLEDRMRIIQEIVPGKQITLAHIIANPDKALYEKLGLDLKGDYKKSAIGIVTMSPAESAIIAADISLKSAGIEIAFIDRVSGTLVITGTISDVDVALKSLIYYCKEELSFTICSVTKT
ncbi:MULTISPECIES: BMC domain-containing protein [unclassified Clostridium]|jgi:ethanolamine utilization protein|uniref:BMC domain-containing protein n=1 Tax=unclassified Clostridium TaxID=2614128 RepID=UPI0025BF7A8D|nr:BMC domain-containing protein [Clostridium sp.]MCI6691570.1 BMC domain-containing protein [Clostridium sp.]MDY2632444.1 BMC domain-containing protein [Clostridium sp.]MDY4251577.1 BMC domain-containing protein [Clostridium sp.]MDY6227185.1 BMC domain-containing protein [Clostridium sp.]